MKMIIEGAELPAEEGSSVKIIITCEGIGEIKKGKIVVRENNITKIDFLKLQNQP